MDKLLHTKAEISAKDEDGMVEGIVGSTAVIDRLGESIEQDGWELTNYKKNPIVLWGHNVREERPPIGKAIKVWLDGVRKKKLMFNIKFDLEDTFAAEIYRKVRDGFLSTVSVGFLPIEYEAMNKEDTGFFAPQRYLKQELLELSFVPVPANPEALTAFKSMGITPVKLEDLYPKVSDSSVPFADTGIAPISEGWDEPGEVVKAELSSLHEMAAWVGGKEKADYKFIHHKESDHKAIWRGVASAMALLLGAKGGADIPQEDREGVYEHLTQHYHEFEKEPPEFKMVENQVLKGLDEEINTLSLEREDKYQVRLIKKLINLNKQRPASSVEKEIITALKQIDDALLKINKKGGEK